MAYTGFGLANDDTGMSYVAMYAHDLQGDPGAWEYVAWPAAGAFPAELMQAELAWSIVLNPEIYDATDAWVRLTDLQAAPFTNSPATAAILPWTMAATAPGRASFSARKSGGI